MFSELGLDRSTFRSSRKMDDSVFYCFYSNDSTKTKTNIKPPKTNTSPRTKKKRKKKKEETKNKNKRPMDHNAHLNNNGHAKPALKSRIQNILTMK